MSNTNFQPQKITAEEIIKINNFVKKMPTELSLKEILFNIKYNKFSLIVSIVHKFLFFVFFYFIVKIGKHNIEAQNILSACLGTYLYIPFIYHIYFYKKHKEFLRIRQIHFLFQYKMYTISTFNETLKSLNTYLNFLNEKANTPLNIMKNFVPKVLSTIFAIKFSKEIFDFLIKSFRNKMPYFLIFMCISMLIILFVLAHNQNKINKTIETINILEQTKVYIFQKNELDYKKINSLIERNWKLANKLKLLGENYEIGNNPKDDN